MTVDVEAPYGKIERPTIKLIGELVEGEPVTVAYSIPAEATICNISIASGNGMRWKSDEIDCDGTAQQGEYTFDAVVQNWDGEEVVLVSKDVCGLYEINLFVAAEGYDSSNMLIRPWVKGCEPVTISGPEQVLTNEVATLTVSAPGATEIQLYTVSGDNMYPMSYTEGETLVQGVRSRVETTLEYAAKAMIDGEWTECSAIFEVEVTAPYGEMPLPIVDRPAARIVVGSEAVYRARNLQEGCTMAEIQLLVKQEDDYYDYVDGFAFENGEAHVSFENLEAGKEYRLTYFFTGLGYTESVIDYDFVAVSGGEASEKQSIEVPNKEITALTEENYNVEFQHPDALAWIVFQKETDWATGNETWYNVYTSFQGGWDELYYVRYGDVLPEPPQEVLAELCTREIVSYSVNNNSVGRVEFCAVAYLPDGWTEPSEIVTANIVAPYGKLPQPTIELVGELVEGQPVTVAYSIPAGTTSGYISITDESGRHSAGEYIDCDGTAQQDEWTFDAFTETWEGEEVTLVTREAGPVYYISIFVNGEGYERSSSMIRPLVKGCGPVAITGMKTALTNETVRLTVSAPGATRVELYDVEYGAMSPINEARDEFLTQEVTLSYPFPAHFVARAMIDGEWTDYSDVFEVEYTAPYGNMPLPDVDRPAEVIEGGSEAVYHVRNLHEDCTKAEISLLAKYKDGYYYAVEEFPFENGEAHVSYAKLKDGREYQLEYRFEGVGYTPGVILCDFVAHGGEGEKIEPLCTGVTALTEENYDVGFRHSEALAWIIFRRELGEEEWTTASVMGGGVWENELYNAHYGDKLPEPSEEILDSLYSVTSFTYSPISSTACRREFCAVAYLPDGWTEPSEIVTVDVTAPYGRLTPPTIELVGELVEGRPVTVAYSIPAEAEQCFIIVRSGDELRSAWDEIDCDGQAKQGEHTIDAIQKDWNGNGYILVSSDAGSPYEISILATAMGYESDDVVIHAEVKESPVEITGPAQALTYEDLTFTVSAEGATEIELYRMFENGDMRRWSYAMGETLEQGMSSEIEQTMRFTARAMIDGEWTGYSKIYELAITAPYGEIPMPDVDRPAAVIAVGSEATYRVRNVDENCTIEMIHLGVKMPQGYYELVDKFFFEDGEAHVSFDKLEAGREYALRFMFAGEGYMAQEIECFFRAIDAKGITVPELEKQVLRNEHFSLDFAAKDAVAWAVYSCETMWYGRWELVGLTNIPDAVRGGLPADRRSARADAGADRRAGQERNV